MSDGQVDLVATQTTRPMMLVLLTACMLSTVSAQSGFCPPGYYDITGGNPNYWSCGSGCPGGSYTDSGCGCACQLDPSFPAGDDDDDDYDDDDNNYLDDWYYDDGTCECFDNNFGNIVFTFIVGLTMAGIVYLLVLMLWVVPQLKLLYKNEGEEVEAMVVKKKTWTETHTSTDKDGQTSTSTTTHYRMTVKYVVANGDTVTKELIPTAKQYSNHFEGNNAAMIYLRPPHDPRAAILKDQDDNQCGLICALVFFCVCCVGPSWFALGHSLVCPCVFIWTVPLAMLLGGWGALRAKKKAIEAPDGEIVKAGDTPAPVTIQAEVVGVAKSTEPPKGSKFDPNTGAPIPKFDPETGKQNW